MISYFFFRELFRLFVSAIEGFAAAITVSIEMRPGPHLIVCTKSREERERSIKCKLHSASFD